MDTVVLERGKLLLSGEKGRPIATRKNHRCKEEQGKTKTIFTTTSRYSISNRGDMSLAVMVARNEEWDNQEHRNVQDLHHADCRCQERDHGKHRLAPAARHDQREGPSRQKHANHPNVQQV